MARERYTLTGQKCPQTDAPLATMPVKVKDKTVTATKRVFMTVEQIGALPDAELLKMVNYAEDLFVRAATTSANTDEKGKLTKRSEAREHWRLNDREGFVQFIVEETHTEKEIAARLDEYWQENLADAGE